MTVSGNIVWSLNLIHPTLRYVTYAVNATGVKVRSVDRTYAHGKVFRNSQIAHLNIQNISSNTVQSRVKAT